MAAMALGANLCMPASCSPAAAVRVSAARATSMHRQSAPGGRISLLCCAATAGAASSGDEVEAEYIHPRYPFSNLYNPVDDRRWFAKLADALTNLTPMRGVKIAAAAAALYTGAELVLNVVFNSKLWMYASWTLIFWPWLAAIAIGASTAFLAYRKYFRNEKLSYRDELVVLLGSLVWFILVPMGHFQGFVEGYPALMFAAYYAYLMIDRSQRLRFFGTLEAGRLEEDWQIPANVATWTGFVGCLAAGHWLAAFEAPPIMTTWNLGWQTQLAAAMVTLALVFKSFGTHFLYKYSQQVNRPNKTVVFGPYRWVRHPIYGSTILLLVGSCLALRAYGSLALMLAGCLFYYEQVTKLEEDLLVRQFGKEYEEYRDRVPKKYVPFVY